MAAMRHKRSCPRASRHTVLAVIIGVVATVGGVAASTYAAAVTKNIVPSVSKDARQLPIDVVSSRIEYDHDIAVLTDVVITQGDTKVQADHAHAKGLDDFYNSHWTFDGNVRINGEQHGSLRSDQAVVDFKNNHIAKATITGNPAEFEQKRLDTDLTARGRAKEIVYDLTDGTVRLSNDAWLSDGHNEISGPELVYNIRQQAVQAAVKPGSDDKVHIIIDPKSNQDPKSAADPNKKP